MGLTILTGVQQRHLELWSGICYRYQCRSRVSALTDENICRLILSYSNTNETTKTTGMSLRKLQNFRDTYDEKLKGDEGVLEVK
jgi:hypothetical protein